MTNDLITCPIENTYKLLNRKWIIVILRDLFLGKKRFLEFKYAHSGLSNNVLSDTLKNMENNLLVEKKVSGQSTEYYLTERGLRLNRILFEMALFGLDELECGDDSDLEVINMFKDYYAQIFKVNGKDESCSIEQEKQ